MVTPPDLGFRLFMALGTEAAELFQKKWLKGGEDWLLGPWGLSRLGNSVFGSLGGC